jgi:uncharacterized protein
MKKFLKILSINILCFALTTISAQEGFDRDGNSVFYHPNGKISSEGTMRNGKPDGYWKTYHENGNIKSEGNRVEHELDGLWSFYDEEARKILEINYRSGKRHGIRKTWRDEEIIVERFANDQKEGLTEYFFTDGLLMRTIPFLNGLEQGNGFEYDREGNIITVSEYRRGFVINRENINRHGRDGLKQGRWKYFFDDGSLQMEGTFRNGKKDGFFKTYDRSGNLLELKKYSDDVEVIDAPEIATLRTVTEYYETGVISRVITLRNGVPEGVSREYDEDGTIARAMIYAAGKVIGDGIVDEGGNKQGPWEEFFTDGGLRAKGTYINNKRTGEWVFYHENGKPEQEGSFDEQGRAVGKWVWYYDNGNLWREEFFINGLQDGLVTEFDEDGNILAEGEYFEGQKEGPWFYNINKRRIEGIYSMGARNGMWKHFFSNGQLSFEGQFIDDNPNGRHVYYYDTGIRKDEENYVMGRKEGNWTRFNEDGTPLLVITYSNNREIHYDGVRIRPAMEE